MFTMGFAMCHLLDPYTPGGEPIHKWKSPCVSSQKPSTPGSTSWCFWEKPHTPASPWGFFDFRSTRARAPPDHYYRDLGFLHSRCDQLSLALAESCWGGCSPVIASSRVSPPSDALCHPRPDSSSLKIVIIQETPPAILLIAVAFQGALSRTIRSWCPI